MTLKWTQNNLDNLSSRRLIQTGGKEQITAIRMIIIEEWKEEYSSYSS